jgi:transposase
MRQKSVPEKEPATQVVKNIRRATRRHFSAEDKIRIVLEGLRGEDSIAELCRREGIVLCRESVAFEPHHTLIAPAGRHFCVDSVV